MVSYWRWSFPTEKSGRFASWHHAQGYGCTSVQKRAGYLGPNFEMTHPNVCIYISNHFHTFPIEKGVLPLAMWEHLWPFATRCSTTPGLLNPSGAGMFAGFFSQTHRLQWIPLGCGTWRPNLVDGGAGRFKLVFIYDPVFMNMLGTFGKNSNARTCRNKRIFVQDRICLAAIIHPCKKCIGEV